MPSWSVVPRGVDDGRYDSGRPERLVEAADGERLGTARAQLEDIEAERRADHQHENDHGPDAGGLKRRDQQPADLGEGHESSSAFGSGGVSSPSPSLDEPAADLFHRDPLGLVRRRRRLGRAGLDGRGRESVQRAPPELLGPLRGHFDEQEAALVRVEGELLVGLGPLGNGRLDGQYLGPQPLPYTTPDTGCKQERRRAGERSRAPAPCAALVTPAAGRYPCTWT
ncbi:MAG: hypothetical protein MZV64_28270 [Ignavibacteriales bacterium]|nr:hypothetical protein [Ignavibacteriales bacterium]